MKTTINFQDFCYDAMFLDLVAAHKAALKLSMGEGNLSTYRALVQKQMNLEDRLMRKYRVTFSELNGAKISA